MAHVSYYQIQSGGNGGAHALWVSKASFTPSGFPSAPPFSVSLWLKGAFESLQRLLFFGHNNGGSDPQPQFVLSMNESTVDVYLGTASPYSVGGGTLTKGVWHNLIVTLSTTLCSVYVDGNATPVSTAIYTSSGTLTLTHGAIGCRQFTDSGPVESFHEPYEGFLADIRVYNIDLSTADVSNVYGPGYPTDDATVSGASLVARWKMDEAGGGQLVDSTTLGHEAAMTGRAGWTDGSTPQFPGSAATFWLNSAGSMMTNNAYGSPLPILSNTKPRFLPSQQSNEVYHLSNTPDGISCKLWSMEGSPGVLENGCCCDANELQWPGSGASVGPSDQWATTDYLYVSQARFGAGSGLEVFRIKVSDLTTSGIDYTNFSGQSLRGATCITVDGGNNVWMATGGSGGSGGITLWEVDGWTPPPISRVITDTRWASFPTGVSLLGCMFYDIDTGLIWFTYTYVGSTARHWVLANFDPATVTTAINTILDIGADSGPTYFIGHCICQDQTTGNLYVLQNINKILYKGDGFGSVYRLGELPSTIYGQDYTTYDMTFGNGYLWISGQSSSCAFVLKVSVFGSLVKQWLWPAYTVTGGVAYGNDGNIYTLVGGFNGSDNTLFLNKIYDETITLSTGLPAFLPVPIPTLTTVPQ